MQSRLPTAFILLSYLILTLVPFLPLALGKPLDHAANIVAMEIYAWLAVWAIFKRPAWFHWLLLPAFIGLPIEVYLLIYYSQGISTHHLGIIAETSPREAMEFLGSTVWLLAAVMTGSIVWFIAVWVAALRTRALAMPAQARQAVLGIVAVLAALAWYGWEFGVAAPAPASASVPAAASRAASSASSASAASDDASDEEEEEDDSSASNASVPGSVAGANRTGKKLAPLPHWLRIPPDYYDFARTWPFGLAGRGVDFYDEREHLARLGQASRSFTFGAHQAAVDTVPETVVLVIGESARYDRWSLNGYARDTNPLLSKETNLVVLPDVVTAVSATRLSVPVIISRKPATQSLEDGFAEKSFITAYKEAGFRTFWLSNQISFGQFDTPVSVFAREADVVQFMNLGGYTNNSNFDDILLAPLQHALADPAPKKLIVLHTLGSHWNYSQRHPKEFDKWQPSLFGVDKPAYTDLKIKPQMNNSYDNSVLYTDWFLSQAIGKLKAPEQPVSLLYVADHGQTLYDGACRLAFHGHNTIHEFRVPAFVWYSDQYKERYPEKIKQLARHRKAKLATENMFHTLLDMGDIRYPQDRLEWSFVNEGFKLHKRYVDSYGWTNYDNAVIKGDCSEVVEKKKK
ncbi:sulfatase-like hydrolase/transferase [Duganella sp. FT92W]|uniref:Sulfatase-like hydrolase/transferase n=1 Tax=Pseudoduganella rivuli TaxID=2666085 RepID=A0A7X2LTZ8_9BURK|nr:phosphoethanolamine transferase [Pseudoduganella rivuli]MRV75120.1 sulfatase-like hydrolase/transferase [Pseudoduganella rivuli]